MTLGVLLGLTAPARGSEIGFPLESGPRIWPSLAPTARQAGAARLFAYGAADERPAHAARDWRFWWNPWTGTAHQVFGSHVRARAEGIEDGDHAERLAREFLARHADLTATDGTNLRAISRAHGRGRWGIVFRQEIDGAAVRGACAHVVLTDDGWIVNFGSDVVPASVPAEAPRLSAAEACGLAERAIGFLEGRDRREQIDSLLWVPVKEGEALALRPAWVSTLRVEEPFGVWVTAVDAETGELLGRENRIEFLDFLGTSRGLIDDFNYCDGHFDRPVAHQRIRIEGVGETVTDSEGGFVLGSEESDPRPVFAELRGPYLNVDNWGGQDAAIADSIAPGVPFHFYWDGSSARPDERAVWLHGNRIHDWILEADPAWKAPSYEMPATVNIDDGSGRYCQAWWDGAGINFFRKMGECATPARLGDMIYHEYGHGITQWIYGGNDCDVGEAGSDAVAMMIDGNPTIGEGIIFGNCIRYLRDCANTLRYPDDYVPGACHENGQILCGFWWDARAALVDLYGPEEATAVLRDLWHWSRRLTLPVSFPDQVLQAFLTDDDDGDLGNLTLHWLQLCFGAANHGFDCLEAASAPEAGAATQAGALRASPNPFSGATRITLRTDHPGAVLVDVHDVAGRRVRRISAGLLPAGLHHLAWDGRDEAGRALPSGVYTLKLTSDGGTAAAAAVILLR